MNKHPKKQKQNEEVHYQRWYRRWFWPGSFFMLLFVWCLFALNISPRQFWEGIPHFFSLVSEMFPPNWAVFTRGKVLWSILEVLSMAFLGTFLGTLFSFFLALLAAGNLTPSPLVRTAAKWLMAAERAVPTLIIILLLVVVVGLGPFAGMIALAIGSVGMLGKLFAEAMENVDPKPLESLVSTGASKLQVIRYAVLPQVAPSLIANTLYKFDINLRAALFLGVVGGGGIGFELHLAMSLFRYADALAITVMTLVVVWLAEKISDYLRRRIIGQEVLQ
ncbi:MAG: phosphonate ABC transporter, permease protein PhnE [Syntrophomonadaceae bacterium]|nr:phosphonate ABC transporter, permease protein PhnE [Syntrophomonadaceae bacterium]